MSVIEETLERMPRLEEQESPWMQGIQSRGRALWQNHRWPGRKTEAWRYTSLNKLEKTPDYLTAEKNRPEQNAGKLENLKALLAAASVPELSAHRIVFVDGRYCAALSHSDLPDALELIHFSSASEEQASYIKSKLGSLAESSLHVFSSLSEAQLKEGLSIRVEKNTRIERPLQMVWLSSGEQKSVNQRLLVDVAEGSELCILEHFISAEKSSFTNGVSEFFLQENARLCHYRLNTENESALHIGAVHASLGRSANLNSFYLALGSALKRIDVAVKHQGEGAHADIQGVYLPVNKQHVDFHTNLEHCVPHTSANEVFRGIVADNAKAVFNGRIHIHPHAQKTNAQLSNKNLLTSNTAEVNTKPELEIYANDVLCAHGATVAQLSDESLHYLRTRGLSLESARLLLSFAFINELIDKLKHPALSTFIRPLITRLFSGESGIDEHLQ